MENPTGSEDGSDEEYFLTMACQEKWNLFDPLNEEQKEDYNTGIDWDTLLFETHENIHNDSAHANNQDEPLERAPKPKFFPFKSQEVSSIQILGSFPISKGTLVGMITAGPLIIPKYDSTASLRLPYVAFHVLC